MESDHDPARPRFLDLGVPSIEVNGTEQRMELKADALLLAGQAYEATRWHWRPPR